MADGHLRVLVTGDRGLYGQPGSHLLALHLGVVLVRDPARATERIEEIARAIDTVRVNCSKSRALEVGPSKAG